MKLRRGHLQFWLAVVWLLVLVSPVRAMDTVADNQKLQVEPNDPYVSPTNGLGFWIWEEKTHDDQTCQLWKTFEIPESGTVTNARLVMTADNEFTVFLDGRELGHGVEWRELFVFDLTALLKPGRHVLAVQCYNGSFSAGMVLGLQVELANGRKIEVKSDDSWKIVPLGVSRWTKQTEPQPDWPSATIEASFGAKPWWPMPDAVIMMPLLKPIQTYFWQKGWFQITLLSVCSLVILISLRLGAQILLYRKERFLLQHERARIARDIHDDIGARMTQLVLHGELAQSELPEDAEIRQQLNLICEEARGLLSTMDEILWAVNPQRDTVRDFAAYVCKFAQEFLATTKIQCLFEVGPEISGAAFDLPLRRSLLMAIKETLNNTVKHSAATELHLQIHWRSQQLLVVVRDNGRGFDPSAVETGRNGLNNMAQRMKELGGEFNITSKPEQGCRVEFSVPLQHPRWSFWDWIWNAKHFTPHEVKTSDARKNKSPQSHDPTEC